MDKCLEVWGVHSDKIVYLDSQRNPASQRVMHLEFNRQKCPVDLSKFFSEFFGCRDENFGKPPYPRSEANGDIFTFNFEIADLVEAFFGVYTPQDFADFLSGHIDMESEQAQAFVKRIREAEKSHKIVLANPKGPKGENVLLCPLNFSKYELASSVPRGWRVRGIDHSDTEDCRIGPDESVLPVALGVNTRSLGTVRERLLRKGMLVAGYYGGVPLDELSLAGRYGVTDGYEFVHIGSNEPSLEVIEKKVVRHARVYLRKNYESVGRRELHYYMGDGSRLEDVLKKEIKNLKLGEIPLGKFEDSGGVTSLFVRVSEENKYILKFHKGRCLVDLSRFFSDFFSQRDCLLGAPSHKRVMKHKESVSYSFTAEEIVETFLGTYPPKQFTEFLRQNIVESEAAQNLLDTISSAEKKYLLAFPVFSPGYKGERAQICPIHTEKWGFDRASNHLLGNPKEMRVRLVLSHQIIPYELLSKNDSGPHNYYYSKHKGLRPDLRNKEFIASSLLKTGALPLLRKDFLDRAPPILLMPYFEGPELNHLSIASHYHLQTKCFEIVRKTAK